MSAPTPETSQQLLWHDSQNRDEQFYKSEKQSINIINNNNKTVYHREMHIAL